MKVKFPFAGEFKLNTLDIVIAVIIGVVEAVIEVSGAIGFIERVIWLTGPIGFLFYSSYNGLTTVLFCTAGWLRRRMGVVILGATVLALTRWFLGDPDGPILLWYSLGAAIPGAIAMWLMNWEDRNLTYFVGNGVITACSILVIFPVVGGFSIAGGPGWALLSCLSGFLVGGAEGILARYLGKALARVGMARARRENEMIS